MRSLWLKLSLAFLVVSLTGALLVAVFARQLTITAFDRFILEQAQDDFIEQMEAFYEANGSWVGIIEAIRSPNQAGQDLPPGAGQQASPPPYLFVLVNQQGYVVLPGGGFRLGNRVPPIELARGIPIELDDEVVGTLITVEPRPARDPNEQRYLERTTQALLLAALSGTVIAVILGILLARTLTKPMRELTSAIRDMAKGRLRQQVPIRTQDELGELAQAFNEMSADLARSNDLRRQMTADIAHDLRTPLTVVSGYLESLRDGVLEATPERIDTIYDETQHLFRLIQDLRTLSLADAGELPLQTQAVPISDLLRRVTTAHEHRAERLGIALHLEIAPDLPEIEIDPERMLQVLGNLVNNALRYTPEGGTITLAALQEGDALVLKVRDTGEGIPPKILPKIFERFYRGEPSRTRRETETGLGLAIAKSIVEMHGGSIM
ncbi:MAG TPA: HAMP domain-containing protein, partial [Anaerolineae bacterium]|nr:HAMP domain-containing protein [Anaerolineae bacterium]